MGHPYDIEHASDLHVKWCQALMQRAGLTTTHQAGPQMRAVMLELRRSLSPDAVLAIANVLPTLERGIFLEDWDLKHPPDPPEDAAEFFDRIYERIKGHHAPVPSIASDVFWVLQNELGPAEAEVVGKICLRRSPNSGLIEAGRIPRRSLPTNDHHQQDS